MEKKYLQLSDLEAYREAARLSNIVWDVVNSWNYFAKDTVGKQFVRSVDSISANIAEGFGRFMKKEKIQFFRYSYGSITESQDWNEKAMKRKLLKQEQYDLIQCTLRSLPRSVHQLIKFTNEKLTQ
ncbi:MAG: four helix bundle protein [Candidatus Peribacteraceae bacterium]|jgi:four helix bundle protein